MLLGFVILESNVKLVKAYDTETIEKALGEEAGFILSYKALTLGDSYSVVIPTYADMDKIQIKKATGLNEMEKFSGIISSLSGFEYKADQSNPLLIEELGANCQAISLVLYKTLKENGFPANLVLDNGISHMYVETKVEGQKYHVDLVEKLITPVGASS